MTANTDEVLGRNLKRWCREKSGREVGILIWKRGGDGDENKICTCRKRCEETRVMQFVTCTPMPLDSRARHSNTIHCQKPEGFRFNTISDARGSRLLNSLYRNNPPAALRSRARQLRANEKRTQTRTRARVPKFGGLRSVPSACECLPATNYTCAGLSAARDSDHKVP